MPLFNIGDYAMAGLNSDLIPSDVESNFLTDGKNIRAVSGGISPFGGYAKLFDLPANKDPHSLFYIDSGTGKFWVIMCNNAIYRLGDAIIDVTPDAMPSVVEMTRWSATDLSGIPIVNHPSMGPVYMTQSMSKFQPLPFKAGQTWHQSGQVCNIMISHKQFLFALGISDNGNYIPDSIRWSSVADIGGIPQTWDALDTTNVAGYTQLGGTGGEIIDALPMRDALVVYRSSGISVIDYIGGQYIWRIRHLNSSIGLLSKDSVVDVRGTHYLLSDGDVYRTDGNSISSIATKRIKKRLRSIDKSNYSKSYAVHNPSNSEVLFVVPGNGSSYPNISYIYNYEHNSWYIRDMPNSVKTKYGAISKKQSNWDAIESNWDGYGGSWGNDSTTHFDNTLVSLMPSIEGATAKIITISGIIGANIEPFDSIIERTDLVLNTLDNATTIQRVYPHIQSANKVLIQIGSQQVPGGPVSWKPAIEFDPNTQRKVDMRTTGILHAYRITANDVKADFTISGIDIIYVEAGKR